MVKFKSYSEFQEDYEEEGYIDKVNTRLYPLKKLNPKQIKRYYLQYVKKWYKAYGGEILKQKERSADSVLSVLVRERDGGCRLLKVLTLDEKNEWKSNHNGLGLTLDAAHVFGKGAFPWMRYDERNVVSLNRFSHNCLDNGKSPVTGKPIKEFERNLWWQRIVGDDWDYLKQRSITKEL